MSAASRGLPAKARALFALLAPGLLVAATGIGAGDLITAALAGIHTGVDLLWAVLIGALLKIALNEQLARFQLGTNRSLLAGWIHEFGSFGIGLRWLLALYFILWCFTVGGALINACGIAGDAIYPLSENPTHSKIIWGLLHSLAALSMIRGNGGEARQLAGTMTVAIGVMFFAVLGSAALLRPEPAEILVGTFRPLLEPAQILRQPGDAIWVLALIGGVGGTLTMLAYGYWIAESGRSGSAGLTQSRIDLGMAYALTALFSAAVLVLAHGLGLSPDADLERARLPVQLAEQIDQAIGSAGYAIFLAGFWAAVFSSMLGVWQSAPYLCADFVRLVRESGVRSAAASRDKTHLDETTGASAGRRLRESRAYRLCLYALATLPAISLWLRFSSVQLAYAVLGALFLPMMAATLLYLNNRRDLLPEKMRNGLTMNLLLSASLLFFSGLALSRLF